MNPVYEDVNMKIKIMRRGILPCYLTEKEEKKILCLLQELFLRFLNLRTIKNCELCVAEAILL